MKFRRVLIVPVVVMTLLTSVLVGTSLAGELGEPVDYTMTFPVDGPHYFSDTFWAGRSHGFHEGQDMLADKMTPVVAVADGVVRLVNWTSDESMNPDRCCSLVLRHDDGWESWYIHLNNDTPGTDDGEGWGIADGITPGTHVSAGQLIGWVGDSGNAEDVAPQLHYELRDTSGTIVNPYRALVAAGGNDVGSGDRDPLVGGARVLALGVAGYDVRILQEILTGLGYSLGGIDGQFGPATDAAVRAFQTAFGIEPDGRVGRTTKTALAGLSFDDTSGDVLSAGSTGSEVVELQTLLALKGYDAGPSDGVFGARTLGAVISFQKEHKLWVDGRVGPATLRKLESLPSVGVSSDTTPDDGTDAPSGDAGVDLSVGSRGADVVELQSLLEAQGYGPGPADGIFGARTRAAVVAFQTDHSLSPDGIAGPKVLDELRGLPPTDSSVDDGTDASSGDVGVGLSVGSRGADVVELQTLLEAQGYGPGPADGIFGARTRAAVVAFQTDHSLSPDGIAGPRVLAELADLSAPGDSDADSATTVGVLSLGSRGPDVVDLQHVLADKGYNVGSSDGVFGPMTLAAVIAFQEDEELQVDGRVGSATRRALGMG